MCPRFQDEAIIARPGCPVAAGLFLHSLQAYTIDDTGRRAFTKDVTHFHKQVDIEGLALYWVKKNSLCTLTCMTLSSHRIPEMMR